MIALDIEKRYPGFQVRARFAVPSRNTTALLGESGSGKTTILHCVAGLATPDSGTIEIDGQAVFSSDRRIDVPVRARGVGLVFQHYALFPHLSALDNVAIAIRDGGAEEARRLLRSFGLADKAGLKPGLLSGGERQRLALARALAARPKALLLDEPFGALDRKTREATRREFLELKRELLLSVILVTHDRAEAELLGDSILELEDGVVSG